MMETKRRTWEKVQLEPRPARRTRKREPTITEEGEGKMKMKTKMMMIHAVWMMKTLQNLRRRRFLAKFVAGVSFLQ